MKNGKIVTRPQRPAALEAQLQQMIHGADNVSEPSNTPVAIEPVSLPKERKKRPRKAPITVTVDPLILAEFDGAATEVGLSRAGALGMAMKMWTEDQAKRRLK